MAIAGKVLVIDDEAVVCAGISRALQRHGYDVVTANEASAALELVRKVRFDVLLVDIMMPRVNGLDLLARLRGEQSEARAIVITGLGAAKHAIEAFRLGAFDFVTKPFTSDELLSTTLRAASAEAARCALLPPPPQPRTFRLGAHSWARLAERSAAVIGVQECFQRSAGPFVSVDLPNEGDELVQGEICARIRAQGGAVFTVWCPISGRVAEANHALLADPTLANTDPYNEGWFARVLPDAFDEESALLSGPNA